MQLVKTTILASIIAITTGCASVNMAPENASKAAKGFSPPSKDMAGMYLYRDNSIVGSGLKKDIWIDGKCIGETARGVFFYKEVKGDREHEVATESEFSPNTLKLITESGNHYFIRQYIKLGLFVGGAGVEIVDAQEGMEEVAKLRMALEGNCDN
jgi:hypothetical protein